MPRVHIFIQKEVADEAEAKAVVDSVKTLANTEIAKIGTVVSASYQKDI